MKELIRTINNIAKYGLKPDLNVKNKETELEKDLLKIYYLYFKLDYEYEDQIGQYPPFEDVPIPAITLNVKSNFRDFRKYNVFTHVNDWKKFRMDVIGDPSLDLSCIIYYLLEIKWRMENNSLADGLCYLEITFYSMIQQKIINLLKYLRRHENYDYWA